MFHRSPSHVNLTLSCVRLIPTTVDSLTYVHVFPSLGTHDQPLFSFTPPCYRTFTQTLHNTFSLPWCHRLFLFVYPLLSCVSVSSFSLLLLVRPRMPGNVSKTQNKCYFETRFLITLD